MSSGDVGKKYDSKVVCKKCQQETWHSILNKTNTVEEDEESEMWENTTFFTLQCLGCENICLLTHYYFSEDIDPQTGDPELQLSVYPSPYKSNRESITGLGYVPADVKSVYEETIKALNSGMVILAAIGARTTIEAIAIQQKITIRGIEKKIEKMKLKEIITASGAKLLLLIKDMGNLATHEIKKHHVDDLSLCLNIIEGVLRELYIHPEEADNTRKVVDGKWKRA